MATVYFVGDGNPENLQSLTDASANLGGVFTDAAGENKGRESPEGGNI
jgi:hypothetical protein